MTAARMMCAGLACKLTGLHASSRHLLAGATNGMCFFGIGTQLLCMLCMAGVANANSIKRLAIVSALRHFPGFQGLRHHSSTVFMETNLHLHGLGNLACHVICVTS